MFYSTSCFFNDNLSSGPIVLGGIVVHLLTREKREELELEKLWTLGPEYDDQFQLAIKQ